MNDTLMDYANRLAAGERLTEDEFSEMIRYRDEELEQLLCELAEQKKRQVDRSSVRIMGTIDLTSYCKNDCYFCGLRRGNRFAGRYRMDMETVMECVEEALSEDIVNLLLQGGDDLYFQAGPVMELIENIRLCAPDINLFLSLGEKSRKNLQRWKHAGASGYLLSHESCVESYYRKLHPSEMTLLKRKQCLWELKELGYRVGCGFMLGSPYQRIQDLAAEFSFLLQLMPDMVCVGPFIPAKGTPMESERPGNVELTYFVLSLLRLLLPRADLPVAQTLELMDRDAASKAVSAGADLLFVDLTPEAVARQYYAYSRRFLHGGLGLEALDEKIEELEEAGYEVVTGI